MLQRNYRRLVFLESEYWQEYRIHYEGREGQRSNYVHSDQKETQWRSRESETTHKVLEVDWLSFVDSGFKMMDHNFSVAVEEFEIAHSVSSERRASYRTMKSVYWLTIEKYLQ